MSDVPRGASQTTAQIGLACCLTALSFLLGVADLGWRGGAVFAVVLGVTTLSLWLLRQLGRVYEPERAAAYLET